jgi:phosphoglycerate kinase
MKTIKEIGDIRNKKFLLRTDLDVPVMNGQITETFRIEKQKETIDYIIRNGGKIVMVAHISDIDSFGPILEQLEKIINYKIEFVKDLSGVVQFCKDSQLSICLLDNIRKFSGEKENDDVFAKELATGFDYYVNNDFAVSHRNQASVVAITKYLPSFAGLQLVTEIASLTHAIDAPRLGKIIVMGGAKTETKIPVIKAFLTKADKILIGGVIANDFLKARGLEIGLSKADANPTKLFAGIELDNESLISPIDFVINDQKILDIGPKTVEEFVKIIKNAKMVIWNGPMGLFEDDRFETGTRIIAEAVAAASESIVGGGDTISAIGKFELSGKYTFVSTGGGAMLEFLSGNVLPGIYALNR